MVAHSQNRNGFTLVEVLLAMAISMMILAGVGYLYYSIAMAWVSHKEGDLVLQHDHSIFAFLEDELTIKPNLPREEADGGFNEVNWGQLPEAGNYDPHYLCWLTENLPVFLKNGSWLDDLSARIYLSYDRQSGLSLIWHPEDDKIERMDLQNYEVDDHVFEFLLTDKVLNLEYAFYDDEMDDWDFEAINRSFKPDERGVPDALVIEVEYKGESVTRTIYLSFSESIDEG